ncbi:hypothetical protein [Pyrobaculum islandicum]|uniref:hypothetical protein n=1 Tax=Pyrobaculum islandicum TaxID=2277 RepID=UPI000AFA2FA1|nr:hypothetical protein [Pyrobaculum islandicum]
METALEGFGYKLKNGGVASVVALIVESPVRRGYVMRGGLSQMFLEVDRVVKRAEKGLNSSALHTAGRPACKMALAGGHPATIPAPAAVH